MLYYFEKGKNATEVQDKKIYAVYGEGAVTNRTCQTFCAGDFFAGQWCAVNRSVEVDSNQNWDVNWEQSMLYHMGERGHTQNIQVNKFIGENEKCVFHFVEKTIWAIWPTQ